MLLNLHDQIKIKDIGKNQDEIKFIGQFKKNIDSKNNSIAKSLYVLRKQDLISKEKKYKIIINKKIPVYAGLGGGTSNAVFLIKYLLKNKINEKLLTILEKEIGSDFRLFFHRHCLQKNLKKIIKIKKKYFFFLFLFTQT